MHSLRETDLYRIILSQCLSAMKFGAYFIEQIWLLFYLAQTEQLDDDKTISQFTPNQFSLVIYKSTPNKNGES